MKISECAELYLSYIADKSENTVKNYKIDLKQFAEVVKDKDIEEITKADIAKFRMVLQSKKLKSSTIARKLASLNSFFQYLIDLDLISSSPITKSHRPKINNKIPSSLTYEEVKKLIEKTDNLMDRVIVKLFLTTGLRSSELLGIKREDIVIERDGKIYNIDFVLEDIKETDIAFIKILGKGNKERLVPISGDTLKEFTEYLKKYDVNPVFPISYIMLWRRIINLGKKAGIYLHPHKLRHTAATLALQSGAELRVIQELLGHASPLTTARYAKVNRKQLVEITKNLSKTIME
ncbi:tyrosine-type recombinase/integrase [Hydrogenothermus marinus]|uniref:Integrase/recombinase XerD n=1 Tax=Hydrogenothermus marinus TaxID=133270 RepID=A0A3M0BQF3_9AQUI|nr:tyrosine-type recombinase/integrase [Hydrogenothermus marinus]RMA93132.1 integrase/recombinase XerD [Hydrogenothermus marinus]